MTFYEFFDNHIWLIVLLCIMFCFTLLGSIGSICQIFLKKYASQLEIHRSQTELEKMKAFDDYIKIQQETIKQQAEKNNQDPNRN